MSAESDTGWDGGYEDAVDTGEGLEDLVLETPHPYDRSDGYTPAPRWATRHEITSRRFVDQVEDLPARTHVQISPAFAAPVPSRKRKGKQATQTRTLPSEAAAPGPLTKQARREASVTATAEELAVGPDQVRSIVFTADPTEVVARRVGESVSLVRKVRSVYSDKMKVVGAAARRAKSTEAKPTVSTQREGSRSTQDGKATKRPRLPYRAGPPPRGPAAEDMCQACGQFIRGSVCGCS